MSREFNFCSGCRYEAFSGAKEPCAGCKGIKGEKFPDLYEVVDSAEQEQHDEVNHPSHYCQEGGMECIDEMILVFGIVPTMHFCLLNVWKYRKRAVFKDGVKDLQKADWYMNKYNELRGILDAVSDCDCSDCGGGDF